jgi:hypothetical protein
VFYYKASPIVRVETAAVTTVGEAFPNQPLPVNDEFLRDSGYGAVREAVAFNTSVEKLVALGSPTLVDGLYNLVEVVELDTTELLTNAQLTKLVALQTNYDAKILGGFTYQANVYQIDAEAQLNMTSVRLRFSEGATNAHGGYWRTADNQNIAMTDAEVIAFFDAAYSFKLGMIHAAQVAKDAIYGASTVELANAVDISLAG